MGTLEIETGQRGSERTRTASVSEKRRIRGEYKIHDREEDDEERTKTREEEEIYLRDINLREKSDDRMVFRKVPFALWIVGTLIMITAIYLLYTLALGYFGVLYKGPKQGYVYTVNKRDIDIGGSTWLLCYYSFWHSASLWLDKWNLLFSTKTWANFNYGRLHYIVPKMSAATRLMTYLRSKPTRRATKASMCTLCIIKS